MTTTDEGFLICQNVPVARTGWYDYNAKEIGLDSDEMVKVYRSPEEVFSKASMASYECKIVTDEHPPDLLTSENTQRYSKGTIRNVRRCKNEDDLLLADLVIFDKKLIQLVEDGKREVSCGYSCVYSENGDGSYSQTSIRGNHVAVVDSGRAGKRVSIKDSQNKESEVDKMTKKYNVPKKKQSTGSKFLQAIGLKHLAMDAEPEDLAEMMDEVSEEYSEKKARDSEEATKNEEEKTSDESPEITAIKDRLDKLTSMIEAITSKDEEKNPEEAIDTILEEIETGDEDEAEIVEDEGLPDAEITDPEERPVNPIPNSDKAWKETLTAMKPIIAGIKDKGERQKATDSLVSAYNKSKKAPKNKTNGYSSIAQAQQRQATDNANKQKQAMDVEDIGAQIAKKYNANNKEVN